MLKSWHYDIKTRCEQWLFFLSWKGVGGNLNLAHPLQEEWVRQHVIQDLMDKGIMEVSTPLAVPCLILGPLPKVKLHTYTKRDADANLR